MRHMPTVERVTTVGIPPLTASPRRLGAAMWTTGIATFGVLYAPQGLLTGIAETYRLTAADASWVVSAATLGLALSILPWALVADRFGRRRMLRVAAVAAAVIAVASPLLPGFAGLLAGRFLLGVALGGIPALAVAYVHEAAGPQRAGVAAGAYVAATSVGGLAGRLVAAPVGELVGWRLSLELLGILAAALTVLFAVLLPPTEEHRPVPFGRSLRILGRQAVNVRALPLYAIGAMVVGAMVAVFNALGFRLEAAPYFLSATAVSLVFLTYLSGTVTSRLSGALVQRFGTRMPLVAGGAAMTVGAAVTLASPVAVIVVGVLLITAGMFLAHATANAATARAGGSGRQHAVALYSVAYYIGSSVLGTVGAAAWTAAGWVALAGLVAVLGVLVALASVKVRD
ncbi:Predicted arabinose efflux permease, MFS family [Microbacterium sp. 77mftsu3.1]|nr:Predicted arabinose efflux permease, MFS family [Microbacterium sp. 77mftsu3.1]